MSTTGEAEAEAQAAAAAAAPTPIALTEEQARALFDILTHHETYAEIEGFKLPGAVTSYGFPFARTTQVPPPQSAGGSRSMTPAGTAPGTPRVRTPLPVPWGGGSSSSRDNKDTTGNDNREGSEEGNGEGEEEDEEEDEDVDGDEVVESTSPLLQMLLTRLVLPFPGVRDLPREFWAVKVQGLLARFGEAGLSESYDKGAMGTRKTLATGASSVVEMVARGVLGGVEDTSKTKTKTTTTTTMSTTREEKGERLMGEYDQDKAEDLARAWEDVVQEWAYGDLLDDMFDHLSRTDDVEAHSPGVKAAVDYAIVHLATFAHHIFILSPEGQYLLKLLENINSLIPYKMIKQTLRIGNAATMLSGMMRLLLAKLSVTSLTNWFGLTANADDGMNLLQRIISLVLSWDASEFRKSADRVEKAKEDRPGEEVLQAIRKHAGQGRSEHDAARRASAEHGRSIVAAILDAAGPGGAAASSLTEAQHARCLEYYSALLSARDRDAITSVLCRQPPDLFTQSIKDVIGAYEVMIRSVHSRVDLREYLEAAQGFVSDFIRASKPKKVSGRSRGNGDEEKEEGEERMASVEDYVRLLRRNRGLWYRWIHGLASRCPDMWEQFRAWAKGLAVEFRQREGGSRAGDAAGNGGVEEEEEGSMRECLDGLFASLDPDERGRVLAAVDAHASYLADLTSLSQRRLQYIITTTATPSSPSSSDSSGSSSTYSGPGVYLSRWQDLLDSTLITPSSPHGPLRRGRDVKHITTMGKLGLGGKRLGAERDAQENGLTAPDVSVVVEALGERFRGVVRERTRRYAA